MARTLIQTRPTFRSSLAATLCGLLVAGLLAQVPGSTATAQEPSHKDGQARRELKEERTETTKTFENADGSFTEQLFSGPVHFQDESGEWREIDSSLVPNQQGEYEWHNKSNQWRVDFDEDLDEDFLRFDIGGNAFRMSLAGATGGKGRKGGKHADSDETPAKQNKGDKEHTEEPTTEVVPATTPTDDPATHPRPTPDEASSPAEDASPTPEDSPQPETTGAEPTPEMAEPTPTPTGHTPADEPPADNRFTYEEVFPGVALQYDIRSDGLKETLVLDHANVPTKYEFTLDGPDNVPVTLSEDNGTWSFEIAPFDETAFVLTPPHVTDSSGRDDYDPLQVANMEVKEGKGGVYTIGLDLDKKWLTDPARVFPVYLDPTITIQPTTEDAKYRQTCSTCTLDVVDDKIYVGSSDTSTYRGALKFDISSIEPGVNIDSAQLKLWWDNRCITTSNPTFCGGTNHQLDVHRMTTAWSGTSTTSQIAHDPSVLSSHVVDPTANRAWMSWNITNTVAAWHSGSQANHGLMIKRATESLGSSGPSIPGRRYTLDPTLQPKLEVTYQSDAVTLHEPTTLHSDGADLNWSGYAGLAPFQKYEVHRSPTPNFAPSATTLLATINDSAITSYRDTTAAPSRSFTYKVVANSSPSVGRTVALPADGLASKLLQPDPDLGKATYMYKAVGMTNCADYGREERVTVGSTVSGIRRPLLHFDLRDIPSEATISDATMSLYHYQSGSVPADLNAHRVTSEWTEGSGLSTCTGDGATWYERQGDTAWTTEGGDFDPNIVATVSKPANAPYGWNEWDISGLAQQWVSGQAPNHGVLLKAADEALEDGRRYRYYSDNHLTDPSLRPKLSVTYSDGSHAQGPTVAISTPGAGEKVSGSAVEIAAAAADDRRVDSVDFLVDGNVVGTDVSEPYSITWNSSSVANGTHNITARATDDAGNVNTSPAVSVTVENSAPPTAAISAPASNATVAGTPTFSATATDDVGVAKVEFLLDGLKLPNGEDTTAPYSIVWDTFNPAMPAYDGPHTLTVQATDTHGQVTVSTPRTVTVANTSGTKYKAAITPVAVPAAMTYKTSGTQDNYPIDVSVKNNSTLSWSATQVFLRYRWFAPDGTLVSDSPNISIGTSMSAGVTRTIRANVAPPTLADGIDSAQYTLRFDLFDSSVTTKKWFAERGNKPASTVVAVNRALSQSGLGFEDYFHYSGQDLGAGMAQATNVTNGNSLVTWSPFAAPGRGLSTFVDITYNSREESTGSIAGNNFSLGVSNLTRLGTPLDIHPNPTDTTAGRTQRWIGLTDSDGTIHRFDVSAGNNTVYQEPPGMHAFLREFSTTDPAKKWAITTPDRTTFYYDTDGYPTSVEDNNGNRLTFTLQTVPSAENPSGVKKRITKVTDAGGRSFDLYYFTPNECLAPAVAGRLRKISDHNGSALYFSYYNDGNLMKLIQRGGRTASGGYLKDRSFVFTYVKKDGSGPAIADPQPTNPSVSTVQSNRLYSVRDPRGNLTTFSYFDTTTGANRWKLKSVTDRSANTTNFGYDNVTRTTTETAPMTRVTKYVADVDGKVTEVIDPLNRSTTLGWNADLQLTRVTEPTGRFTEFAYNANGMLTDTWDQLRNHTSFEYENVAIDAKDVVANWKAGRAIGHISQLRKRTDPKGNASATPVDDFQWLYDYSPNGNLTKVTDPEGFATTIAYNTNGTIATVTDANNHATTFPTYDANGLPTKVVDAKGQTTRLAHDSDGLLRWVQEPRNSSWGGGNDDDDSDDNEEDEHRTVFFYDSFHRLGAMSTTKSGDEEDDLIWTGIDFDSNDNVIAEIDPHYGEDFTRSGPRTTIEYDAMDRPTLITGPDKTADPLGERTAFSWDAAGRLTKTVLPKGVQSTAVADDYAIINAYDDLDRVKKETRHEFDSAGTITRSLKTLYCYDNAGDLTSVTAPKANVDSIPDCTTPPDFSTRYGYDEAHRLTSVTDSLDRPERTSYDANGNVATITNAANDVTTLSYDERGLMVKVTEPFTATRNLTTKYEYDGVGNLKRLISPRAWDASADKQTFTDFVTTYQYDEIDQLVREDLPTGGGTGAAYVHHSYDAAGNLVSTSLPVTTSDPAQVPANKKTTLTYFDTGWIRSMDDPGSPRVHFDYRADGLQTSRTPQGDPEDECDDDDELDEIEGVFWGYYADGMLKEVKDKGGQIESFVYDANNNLTRANDAGGLTSTSESAFDIEATYDTLDRLIKVRQKRLNDPDWRFSSFGYDNNSNMTRRSENGEETPSGTVVKQPRVHELSYDEADWITTQIDRGTDGVSADDLTITNIFTNQGWEKSRKLARGATTLQTTTWDYFANGKLRTLDIKNGAGVSLENHTVSYDDSAGRYANGHRTSDTFTLKGPNTNAPCRSGTCTMRYGYDARDRLTSFDNGRGQTTDYVLDPSGNITTETKGGTTRTFTYVGDRLATMTKGAQATKYHYDAEGNLDCATDGSGSSADCNGTDYNGNPSARVTAEYSYDYLNRLTAYRSFNGGAPDDSATYVHDALDRVVRQSESHGGTSAVRTTDYSYLGLSKLATGETHKNSSGAITTTKSYTYDTYGNRVAMTNTPQGSATQSYTFGYDVHGSTSLLIGGTGQAVQSYGYGPYGDTDAALTSDGNSDDPLNAFRYTGKRFDSGSGTLDMGARHFAPDTGRFLQQDFFNGAMADLGLGLNPLTQNRYGLAAGNPVSYMELDGHIVVANGSGTGGAGIPKGGIRGTNAAESRVNSGVTDGWQSWATSSSSPTASKAKAKSVPLSRKHLATLYANSSSQPLHEAIVRNICPSPCFGAQDAAELQAFMTQVAMSRSCNDCPGLGEAFGGFLSEVSGVADVRRCLAGDGGSCAWAAAGVVPVSRLGRLGKLAQFADSLDELSAAARMTDRGGYTKAGRSLTKHATGQRSGGGVFPALRGGPGQINALAEELVDDILTTPGTRFLARSSQRYGGLTIDILDPGGRGLRYGADGRFIGFIP